MPLLETFLIALLLSNECGDNQKENIAIASTVWNRSKANGTLVYTELLRPNQYPINNKALKKRLLERGLKSFTLKIACTVYAKFKPLKYTHFCALYANPKWCVKYTIIGQHKFVFIMEDKNDLKLRLK